MLAGTDENCKGGRGGVKVAKGEEKGEERESAE